MAKKITVAQAMTDLVKRKHRVSDSTADKMLKKYKAWRNKLAKAKENDDIVPYNTPEFPLAITFNKKAIKDLVKLPGFTGLRISPGINAANELALVLEGIDVEGNVIATPGDAMAKDGGGKVDEGQMSPPYP